MFAVALTNHYWYKNLSRRSLSQKVNFWTPGPWNIRKLKKGDLFLFLLKAPYRQICGYGRFHDYENISVEEAWFRFGKDNGVQSLSQFSRQVEEYMPHMASDLFSVEIGSIVLTDVHFFNEKEFIPFQELIIDFPDQVMKFKYFEEDHYIEDLLTSSSPNRSYVLVEETTGPMNTRSAEGDRNEINFQKEVMKNYEETCAISGETTFSSLQPTYVQPYLNESSNHSQNGLLLRADYSKLWDEGLITADEHNRIKVSELLASSSYADLGGIYLRLPSNQEKAPSKEAIEYHRAFVFRSMEK
ncbi:HNH endonuclease [Jeotgalibacillus soli]|uniref:HNH nuclease domain-containing protein n=1 Tax=Jeotgalibacillus soli TaxID=889306 RepID=A0A0C2VYK0_9BACL|nr:HNH endonuclease [Jeotgalibacillus soli]KIL49481.1 hypothetical protein KP78_09490 [Jeotgalibacillus soli]